MGAYWGCYRGARARPSIQDFDAILFDDRIGQHFMRDGFDVRLRLLARGSTGQRDFEELALTHFGDGGEPEAVERRAHGLALRVENGGLRSYEYASFHGTPIIACRAACVLLMDGGGGERRVRLKASRLRQVLPFVTGHAHPRRIAAG